MIPLKKKEKKKRGVLFLPLSDVYVKSFLYPFTLIKYMLHEKKINKIKPLKKKKEEKKIKYRIKLKKKKKRVGHDLATITTIVYLRYSILVNSFLKYPWETGSSIRR